ncbi:MFS general substrate transporter [Gautieria morchelliformis]|nr:MFS general substrate transporter [Gautieria morchelliformis]
MSDTQSLKKSPENCESTHIVDLVGEAQPPPPVELTAAQELALYRKVDLRLMPIVSLMYLLASMDRGNIGNAKIAGLTTQLNMTGSQFNTMLTIATIVRRSQKEEKIRSAYHITTAILYLPIPRKVRYSSSSASHSHLKSGIPSLLLQKFRPSRWLSGLTIAWGLILTLNGFSKTYAQLVVARVFLGVVEAGLFPGVVYYMTLWYPRHALQYRFGFFIGSATLALAFAGLLAFAIGFMDGIRGLQGWSWIFILEGVATVVAGILAALVLVDFPAAASFLTPEEREYIAWKLKCDNAAVGGEDEEFSARYVWAALVDWQVWLHILVFLAVVTPVVGMSIFLPSIVIGFGYSVEISQLLTAPVYVAATITALSFGYYSDKLHMRSPFIFAGLLLLVAGLAIEVSPASPVAKYMGTFLCMSGGFGAMPGTIAWLGNNLSGQCKRAAGMAVHIGMGNFAVLIGVNIFRAQDAPRYIIAHAVELGFVGMGMIAVPIIAIIYSHINAQREALARNSEIEKPVYTEQELRQLGDKAPDFRYTI